MSRNKVKQRWPDTACCEDCEEHLWTVLRRISKDYFQCHNCNDTRHQRGQCHACGGENFPIEGHHVEMRRNNPDWIVDICLNCHAEVTMRQLTWDLTKTTSRELGLKDMHEIGERRRKWRERNKLAS